MGGVAAALKVAVTAVGGFFAANPALAAVATFVASAGASTFLAKRAASFDAGLRARNLTVRGTIEPQKLIYGEAMVSGPLAIPPRPLGIKARDLWNIVLLAGHEVDAITDVELDSRLITNAEINGGAAAGGDVTSGEFGPVRGMNVVKIKKYYGTSTQTVDTDFQAAEGAAWTANHRLRGIAYLVTKFSLWDKVEKLWETGEPTNVRALVRGKIVYDPRLDTSPGANPDNQLYFAWTDNPALCAADFVRDPKFGPQPPVPAARIDWDSVVTAADVCDVLVSTPGATTQKRFTCNGVLYGTATPKENLESILSAMNGSMVYSGGLYIFYAGAYEAPTETLTESEMTGPIGISSSLAASERVNTMKATYLDKDKGREPTETEPIDVPAYVTRDGGEALEETIDLPMTDTYFEAQRIILKKLHEANLEKSITIPCDIHAARFVPGQRINVQLLERGWNPKIFKVIDWKFIFGDVIGVELELREDDPGAYADPVVGDYNTRTAAGALVEGEPVPVPPIDTIPRQMAYGEGSTDIEVLANQNAGGGTENGVVRLRAGKFILPSGTIRELALAVQVNTPWTGGTKPEDDIAYIVWGDENPDTRFDAEFWGTPAGETAGLFPAIYDRTRDTWYAVANDGSEYEVTVESDDVVFARLTKEGTTGGIDGITTLVSYSGVRQLDFEKVVGWASYGTTLPNYSPPVATQNFTVNVINDIQKVLNTRTISATVTASTGNVNVTSSGTVDGISISVANNNTSSVTVTITDDVSGESADMQIIATITSLGGVGK